jgi:hypothetical protein
MSSPVHAHLAHVVGEMTGILGLWDSGGVEVLPKSPKCQSVEVDPIRQHRKGCGSRSLTLEKRTLEEHEE